MCGTEDLFVFEWGWGKREGFIYFTSYLYTLLFGALNFLHIYN